MSIISLFYFRGLNWLQDMYTLKVAFQIDAKNVYGARAQFCFVCSGQSESEISASFENPMIVWFS